MTLSIGALDTFTEVTGIGLAAHVADTGELWAGARYNFTIPAGVSYCIGGGSSNARTCPESYWTNLSHLVYSPPSPSSPSVDFGSLRTNEVEIYYGPSLAALT